MTGRCIQQVNISLPQIVKYLCVGNDTLNVDNWHQAQNANHKLMHARMSYLLRLQHIYLATWIVRSKLSWNKELQ
ncbi:hypothetical protein M758_11G022700 [Ceratodon purpureus]|nr:hypothetical protein M758_11G022700 [Ceratodon purpureus]